MLRGLAFDYYYINLKSNLFGVPFDKLYKAIYNYFKGPKYKCDIFTQWNVIKLQIIIDKNPKKSIIKCLQVLIKDLWYL